MIISNFNIINTLNEEQLKWLYTQIKNIVELPTDDHIFNELSDFKDKIKTHIESKNFNEPNESNMIKTINE